MQILTYILLSSLCIVSIFALWAYFPYMWIVWEYGSIISSFFSFHAVIISCILLIASLILFKYNYSLLTTISLSISIAVLIAWIYPVVSAHMTANKNNVTLSIKENLLLKINRGEAQRDRSVKYLSRDWNDLYFDYYPAKSSARLGKPLMYVHGWWFTGWNRSEDPAWINFFITKWYDVFDVGYTLANDDIQTWDIAGREIQTALWYIAKNAQEYNVDMSELVLVWSSAWWTLALQAAYWWEERFTPYDTYDPVSVKRVIALFPATDLEDLWERNTQFYGISSRDVQYIWWTPKEYPQRYEHVKIENLLTVESPETLIIHGESDTLIPIETISTLRVRLNQLWVDNSFVSIPFAQHWFTYFSSSLWFQISRWVIDNFLSE